MSVAQGAAAVPPLKIVVPVRAEPGREVTVRGLLRFLVDEFEFGAQRDAFSRLAQVCNIHTLCTSLVDNEPQTLVQVGAEGHADLAALAFPDPQHAAFHD